MGLTPLVENAIADSIKTELSILQKAANLDRGKPTLPPIKHIPTSPTLPEQPLAFRPSVSSSSSYESSAKYESPAPTPTSITFATATTPLQPRTHNNTNYNAASVPIQPNTQQSARTEQQQQQQQAMTQHQDALRIQKKRAANAAKKQESLNTVEDKKLGFSGGFLNPTGKIRQEQQEQQQQETENNNTTSTHSFNFEERLPEGWAEATTRDGRTYYVDHVAKITTWTDPRTLTLNSNRGPYQPPSSSTTTFKSTTVQHNSKNTGLFEDPRKKAEDRMMQRIKEMKG
ncbi:hypothetical protein BDR26DRAFT_876722 [Obelidium mucronatum]|nr:hypothetical protein BDR26DRAFT_876722 [Obelidium mucronatum]